MRRVLGALKPFAPQWRSKSIYNGKILMLRVPCKHLSQIVLVMLLAFWFVSVTATGQCTISQVQNYLPRNMVVQSDTHAQFLFPKLVPDVAGHSMGFSVGVTAAGQCTIGQIQNYLTNLHASPSWQQQGAPSLHGWCIWQMF